MLLPAAFLLPSLALILSVALFVSALTRALLFWPKPTFDQRIKRRIRAWWEDGLFIFHHGACFLGGARVRGFCPRRKVSMMRTRPPHSTQGSRRVREGGVSATGLLRLGGCRDTEQCAYLGDFSFVTGSGEEAIVTNTMEPVREDMRLETHDLQAVATFDPVILPPERHGIGISSDKTVVYR